MIKLIFMPKWFLSAFIVQVSIFSSVAASRTDQNLSDSWKFVREDVGLTAPTDSWLDVTIPHTWNTKSADAKGKKSDPHFKYGYYRGACWYDRVLVIPSDWAGRRVFIRFEAASTISRTYLNGQLLGEHRGGFTAFCYELTPQLKFGSTNELRVQVDNSYSEEVPPIYGDFNINGGIYRPVHLFVTDPVCISPLDFASPGVYLSQQALTDTEAKVQIKTIISNGSTKPALIQVKTEIKDENGKVVAGEITPASIAQGASQDVLTDITISSPHRWNGRKDPYLYTTTVTLLKGNTLLPLDSIDQPLGFRTVAIDEQRGFLLNNQPYPIHGVNRHQDWGGQGWAATSANEEQDAQIILDLGATAVRLAHYPQSDHWYYLCDHNGLVLWNEIPLVNIVRDTPEFNGNAEQQLREMMHQRYNHPSIAFWGLSNELHTKDNTQETIPLIQHLHDVLKELDDTRIDVSAVHVFFPFHRYSSQLGFNIYPGWYGKDGVEDVEKVLKKKFELIKRSIAISEYGAGANPLHHAEGIPTHPTTTGPYHPEEWQTLVHEADWAAMKDNPQIWGTFVWAMFDFATSARNEGSQPYLNDKGLVTQDRQIKKDSYYFYQANWTDQPMVRLASSRMTPRKLATTEVQAFSNCDKVELIVNDTSRGTVTPDRIKVCKWEKVTLKPGSNKIKVTASTSQGSVTDTCTWILDPSNPIFVNTNAPAPSPASIPTQ